MDHLHPITIIIADDDREDREMFRDIFLNNDKFKLIGCLTSGVEVFDEISRKKNIPDVLLIDMYMPFFTGIQVAKALEKLEAGPTMTKFVISTAVNVTEKDKHIDNPYIIFLKKPVTIQEMRELPNIMLKSMIQKNNMQAKRNSDTLYQFYQNTKIT